MPQYSNEKRGVLFKADEKPTDKHPDYKGSCEIDRVQYWVSAWSRTSRNGKWFLSLQFVEKRVNDRPAAQTAKEPRPEEKYSQNPIDDDIPF